MQVILYTMLVGQYPFHDSDLCCLFKKIRQGTLVLPETLCPKVKCLLKNLLRVDYSERMTTDEISYHIWFDRRFQKDYDGFVTTYGASPYMNVSRITAGQEDNRNVSNNLGYDLNSSHANNGRSQSNLNESNESQRFSPIFNTQNQGSTARIQRDYNNNGALNRRHLFGNTSQTNYPTMINHAVNDTSKPMSLNNHFEDQLVPDWTN